MSSQITVVKSTDDEPEEGEIQDDEELEDVSSDDEISSVAKRDVSALYHPTFPRHESSKNKRPCLLPTPRSDMIFHGPQKGDHVSQFVPKRSRSRARNGGHDYYETCQRYKSFKEHHSKGRVHEKENKARETKKLSKKNSFWISSVELRGGYPGSEHGETRISSTSSKATWHKSELKEKHKKKKKSKSNKNYPLGEVHESQRLSEKSADDVNVIVKSTMEVKGELRICDKIKEDEKDYPKPDQTPSSASSDIEILEVPVKVPEVITIGDSDDDLHTPKPMSVVDNAAGGNNGIPGECVKNVSEIVDSSDIDEYLLREAALKSSKSHVSSDIDQDDEVLQLRLAALRSAIIRKHEERKKRGITLTKRDKNTENKQVLSISPLSSPNHCNEDSFVRSTNDPDTILSSEKVNAISYPEGEENDTEDKIAAVDMELDSDEDRDLISTQCEDSSTHVISKVADNDGKESTVGDELAMNLAEKYICTGEVVTPDVSHCVPASHSTAPPFVVESVEFSSGYIIGDHDHDHNDQESEFDSKFSLILPNKPQSESEDNINSDKETGMQVVPFQEIKTSQQSSTVISVDVTGSEIAKSENKQINLFFRQPVVSEDSDLCSTVDLDLESMIVLDEVGRCSDDNKSESSISEMVRCVKELSCSEVSYIHVTPVSCGVYSGNRLVESSCGDKSISQSLNVNVLANSVNSGKGNEKVCVTNCAGSNIESNFQHAEHLRSNVSIREADVELQLPKGLKDDGFSDNSTNMSGACESKDFKMLSGSNSLVNSVKLSCESNSDVPCTEDNASELPFKGSCVGEVISISPSCEIVQLSSSFDKTNDLCEAISCYPSIPEKEEKNDLQNDTKLQLDNVKSTICNSKSIPMEEDEELLRLSLLAMLNKRSSESTHRKESIDSFQASADQVLKTVSTEDSGSGENVASKSDTDLNSFKVVENVTSGYNEIQKKPQEKRVVPLKSLSSNLGKYHSRLNLSAVNSKLYTSRKRLCSIIKRGAKSNKSRMVKNNSTRPNVNVPELVINLGEDSDSCDELTVCETQKVLEDGVANPSESKDVPPDFEKRLDLLLKQARFEQEINTSEEKDEECENKLELTNVNFTANLGQNILIENGCKSSRKCAQSGMTDKLSSKASSVSTSHAQELSSFAGNSGVIPTIAKNFNINLVETKNSSSGKIVTCDTKKSAPVSGQKNPAMSLVDIGLLPSSKQKEYIRLKRQLAQLVGRNYDKSLEKPVPKKICDENPKAENSKLTSLKSNVAKDTIVFPSQKTSSTHRGIQKVQMGLQTQRNEFAKGKRLVPFVRVPAETTSQTRVLGRLPPTAQDKLAPLPIEVVSSARKKVTNTTSTKKLNPAFKSTGNVQKKIHPSISHFSALRSVKTRDTKEVLQRNCEPILSKEGKDVETLTPTVGENVEDTCKKSLGVKRKISVSESSEVVHKITKSIFQCSAGQSCDLEGSDNCRDPNIPDVQSETTVLEDKKLDDELTSSNFSDSNLDDSHSEAIGPVDKKLANELWSSEQKLMARRYQVLEDISSVRMNLHDIKTINVSKQHILRDIKSLKEKLSFAETQLERKEELLVSLYSQVEKTKRNIMRGQSETLLLSVECEEKGCIVHGSDYNVPSMCTDLIRNGMLSISQELQDIQDGKNCEELLYEASSLCTSREGVPQLKEDTVVQYISDLILDTDVEESRRNVQSYYSSPLDAMRTETGSNFQAVLCPYHIMGSCKDKECSYLH